MPLTQAQMALVERTRSVGAASEAEALSESDCLFLIATIARDLGLASSFPELRGRLPSFFEADIRNRPELVGPSFPELFERLLSLESDADSFFACLGALYKARLKYANILRMQPLPTMDQVGPRGLLQYGCLCPEALAGFLRWRKWLFDIDNRAGQETGYLFEPIIAGAIGGTAVSARKSPVRRATDGGLGRQVDCLKGRSAYEIKIRVTIAASGQGRWAEELDFPADCASSGYVPVLIVLDPTPNPKLQELSEAYRALGGRVHVGDAAWAHLDSEAGPTMAVFLERYVRAPMAELLGPGGEALPDLRLSMGRSRLSIQVGQEVMHVERVQTPIEEAGHEGAQPQRRRGTPA